METLFTNKNFIKASIALVVLLALFVLALFINEVKSSDSIGRGTQGPNIITVTGKGEVMAVSDIATVSFTLSKDGATAKEAQNLLNENVSKIVNYLKDQKIEEKDIKSEYGGLNPKYSNDQIVCVRYPCPQGEPKIVGYTANQTIVVKIREVDTANDIRTGLATVGVTNINGPDFSIDDEEGFKDEAREMAIKDAREKAKVLAQQLGVRLGKVANFSENGYTPYPMYESKVSNQAAAGAMDAGAPVLPKGENKIMSNVTITYEIR
jgi:uncharacterized protein